jgi:hypothetical protein
MQLYARQLASSRRRERRELALLCSAFFFFFFLRARALSLCAHGKSHQQWAILRTPRAGTHGAGAADLCTVLNAAPCHCGCVSFHLHNDAFPRTSLEQRRPRNHNNAAACVLSHTPPSFISDHWGVFVYFIVCVSVRKLTLSATAVLRLSVESARTRTWSLRRGRRRRLRARCARC